MSHTINKGEERKIGYIESIREGKDGLRKGGKKVKIWG
jgi:hypothetical protein